jgi:hypothetical protein
MAQSDIIQKDLGLVTAYGYALAGGYQGTEEQFKIDFANLMAGRYSGSELNRYAAESAEDEPFIPQRNGDICGTSIMTYGNISFTKLRYIFKSSITISKNTVFTMCIADIDDGIIGVQEFEKYLVFPMLHPSSIGSGSIGNVELIGLSSYVDEKFKNKISVGSYNDISFRYPNIVERMSMGYNFRALETINVDVDDYIDVEHVFMNSIGQYKEYYPV